MSKENNQNKGVVFGTKKSEDDDFENLKIDRQKLHKQKGKCILSPAIRNHNYRKTKKAYKTVTFDDDIIHRS